MAESQKAFIRPYEERDREGIAHVCLQTGSATLRNIMPPNLTKEGEAQPEALLPHLQIHPYTALQPEFCFVLVSNDKEEGRESELREDVVGYIVATPDTVKWLERVESEYFPSQRTLRPWMSKDWKAEEGGWEGRSEQETEVAKKLLSILHNPANAFIASLFPKLTERYPASFNTAILPEYAGKGYGRALQEVLWKKLREEKIPGIHLEGREGNTNATAFYRHLGFENWDGIHEEGSEKGVYELNGVRGRVMVKKL